MFPSFPTVYFTVNIKKQENNASWFVAPILSM
jgi:hypothetical protein